jgi:hypothetical protein
MDGIDVFIGVFVKLIPVMLAVVVPLAIYAVLEHRDGRA